MPEDNAKVDEQAGALPLFDPLVTAKLTDEQVALLQRHGQALPTVAGQVLFREGDRSYDFMVILSGSVTIVDHHGGSERALATGGPGEFLAELSILTGERLFTGAVVREPGAILVVPVDVLRSLIGEDQALGDLIVRAAFRRRQWLVQAQAGMTIVGSRTSPDAQRLREFATRNRLPYVWADLDEDPDVARQLERFHESREQTPIVVMRGGEVLHNPTNAELARAAGFGVGAAPNTIHDLLVIGAGPAGLAAAVYGASEGLSTAIIDGLGVGGQIGTTSRIENYLGFPVGVSGDDFAQRALIQVLRFGATLLVPCTATGLAQRGDVYAIRVDSGDELVARSVIIAGGVAYRKLDAVGLEPFEGVDVFYTPLAAKDEVRPGEPAVIIGGGNSAGQAALALAEYGHRVTMVIRGSTLADSMSQYLIERIEQQPSIEILTQSVVREASGDHRLERIVVEELATSTRHTVAAAALFVLIGAEPHTQWLNGTVDMDSHGFIVTGPALEQGTRRGSRWKTLDRDPYLLETSLPGIFAAGDVRSDSVKRVAAAVGEGSIAVRFVSEFLGRRAGLAAAAPPAR
jgi:thioredoxin reductase (NADPH)